MKNWISIGILFLSACINHPHPSDIAGVYTRISMGEYSRANDTLIIYEFDKIAGNYVISRKTGFIRFKEGVPQPREYHSEKMIALYDEATNQLTDRKSGRIFSFKNGKLLFGTAEYNKTQK